MPIADQLASTTGLFRAVSRVGKLWGHGITQNVVWYLVKGCCEKAGLARIAPHDLRRTCAKLCHSSGGELEQIQFLLGHASVQTTERYLGCKQNLGHPVNDRFALGVVARPKPKPMNTGSRSEQSQSRDHSFDDYPPTAATTQDAIAAAAETASCQPRELFAHKPPVPAKNRHYTNNLPWQAVRQLLVLTPDCNSYLRILDCDGAIFANASSL
jgi:hypothetical protein